ncbi:hypothetical protein GW17_00031399 [Ensete ventricosum]|nr:hypothetical protein GW17_00031399 [Ensete ventricosum]
MPACRSVRFNPHRRCNGMTIYKPMTPLSHLPRRRWRWIQCTGGPDGMSSAMPAHVLNINMEEPVKRKRRRLRKYGPCPDPYAIKKARGLPKGYRKELQVLAPLSLYRIRHNIPNSNMSNRSLNSFHTNRYQYQ